MILVDYNQIVIAGFFASIGNHHNVEVDENLLRHLILNTIRSLSKKFKKDYGEIVICADGMNSWRRDKFPYYKASRRKNREESEIDWSSVFETMSKVKEELDEFFPYKVLHFNHLEADDCIGILCHEYGKVLNDGGEQILIVSSDKDYIQLHSYANVSQYNNVLSKWVKHSDPAQYLTEHILKGDRGDGIPNILSPDNALVMGIRQKPMTKKRIMEYSDPSNIDDPAILKNYNRNKTMIDLSEIPNEYYDQVIKAYNEYSNTGRDKLFNYFVKNKLKNLMTDIGDF